MGRGVNVLALQATGDAFGPRQGHVQAVDGLGATVNTNDDQTYIGAVCVTPEFSRNDPQ